MSHSYTRKLFLNRWVLSVFCLFLFCFRVRACVRTCARARARVCVCVCLKEESVRVANVRWNRVPYSQGLRLEGTLAKGFGVSSGECKESYVI